jgi:hypothetical protein
MAHPLLSLLIIFQYKNTTKILETQVLRRPDFPVFSLHPGAGSGILDGKEGDGLW